MESHKKWFDDFAAGKISQARDNPSPLILKRLHTFKVYENACAIAREEAFNEPVARGCKLAALYHDLARFDQYLQYGTFKDRLSKNHGHWAVKLLKDANRLNDEPRDIKKFVLTAIALHNRRALSENLAGDTLTVCKALRDADKIDIARVMAEHLSGDGPYNPTVILGLEDRADLYSPRVIQMTLAGGTPSYDDLSSLNDFRLLLGSWYFELGFEASRKLYKANGDAYALAERLPASGPYARARAFILDKLA